MNPRSMAPQKKSRPVSLWKRLVEIQNRFKQWFLSHLILGVLGTLVVSWLLISFFVYRQELGVEGSSITSYGKAVWWGIVTFLTVGYGDYTPVTSHGRMWAGVLMLIGVFGVAIITSKISSYFLEQMLREGRGLVDRSRLKDHFIVCGWKEDMHQLLNHILDFNPSLHVEQLVLVAHLDQTQMDAITGYPRLKGIQFIIGHPHEAVVLERAAPERARKVLILADRTPKADGSLPSMTEVDARTIMIAMTLANVARGTLVTAEILDPKMDHYLKLASVGEIIYSREYSRLLLGNAAGGTGIANVIFDLLDPKTSAFIRTQPVTDGFIGKTYGELRLDYAKNKPNWILLGILENTGNIQWIKEQALKQAQKTPDMHRLLQNLRGVKQLQCNHPVFNPAPDYQINEGSMTIIVETHAEASHGTSAV